MAEIEEWNEFGELKDQLGITGGASSITGLKQNSTSATAVHSAGSTIGAKSTDPVNTIAQKPFMSGAVPTAITFALNPRSAQDSKSESSKGNLKSGTDPTTSKSKPSESILKDSTKTTPAELALRANAPTESGVEKVISPKTDPTVDSTASKTTPSAKEIIAEAGLSPIEALSKPALVSDSSLNTDNSSKPAEETDIETSAKPSVEAIGEPTTETAPEPTTQPTSEPSIGHTTEPTAEPTTETTTEHIAQPVAELTGEPTATPDETKRSSESEPIDLFRFWA
jgi:hypothetical protein